MKYEAPKMQVIEISAMDVITTSGIVKPGSSGSYGEMGEED